MGFFLAVLEKSVNLDESVLCLTGVAGSERIDTILIANPRRDFPWLPDGDPKGDVHFAAPREVARVIEIALRFAAEGREGRPIGTIFVIGDGDDLAPCVRQLVLNPCEGHANERRNIHNPQFLETLREFAAMDGAFIVSNKGVVESAGTYLDAPGFSHKLAPGLGARHTAAAAITASTPATSVVVSESSGTVTVFHDGQTILELEKPQLTSAQVVREA
jgi:DNA integrity scanning protein DisA with diadenylate cyclase activity